MRRTRAATSAPASGPPPADGWVRVGELDALPVGTVRGLPGLPIVVGRSEAGVFAVGGYCPHTGARLEKGRIVGDCVECPVHGALFALAGGRRRSGPARRGLPSYDVRVHDGIVYVATSPRPRTLASRLRR